MENKWQIQSVQYDSTIALEIGNHAIKAQKLLCTWSKCLELRTCIKRLMAK